MIRAYSETYDRINEDLLRMEIHDSEFSGTAFAFDVADNFFTLKYDEKDDEVYAPIMASNVDFQFLVEDSAGETLMEDMASSYEDRFVLKVLRNGSLYWIGNIITDGIKIPDLDPNYFTAITATDGIGALKGVKYMNKSGTPHSGKDDFADIIARVLMELKYVNDFYSVGSTLLKVNMRWFEAQMTHDSVDATYAPLKNSRVDNAFATKEASGDDLDVIDCYQVLENIGKRFKMQLKQVNGAFYFSQPKQQGGAITLHSYDKTGSHLGKSTEDHSENFAFNKLRMNGSYHFYPPVLRVTEEVKVRNSIYQNNLLPIPIFDDTVYDLGELVTDNDNYLVFSGEFDVKLNNPSVDTDPILAKFDMRVRVGSYYLQYNSADGVYEWDSDSSARVTFQVVLSKKTATRWRGQYTLNFNTEEIPSDDSAELEITLNEFISTGGTVITAGSYSFDGVSYLRNGALGDRTLTFTTTNEDGAGDAVKATKEVNTGTLLIGDSSDNLLYQAIGMIEVNDGSSWSRAYSWEVEEEGQNTHISDLAVREVASIFYNPVKAYTATFRNPDFTPLTYFTTDGANWIFTGGTLNAKRGTWDASFLKLSPNDNSGGGVIDDPEEIRSLSPSNQQVIDTVKDEESVEETNTKLVTASGKDFEVSENLLYPKNPSDSLADKDLVSWDSSDKKLKRQINYLHTLGLKNLTSEEVTQLKNIDTTTISADQWGYVGVMNQSVKSTDSVTFKNITQSGSIVGVRTITNGNESLGANDYVVVYSDTNSSDEFTISGSIGRRIEVINGDDVNDLTISATGGTINNASSITLGAEHAVTLVKIAATKWVIINKY
jgi:hypothetical protein